MNGSRFVANAEEIHHFRQASISRICQGTSRRVIYIHFLDVWELTSCRFVGGEVDKLAETKGNLLVDHRMPTNSDLTFRYERL